MGANHSIGGCTSKLKEWLEGLWKWSGVQVPQGVRVNDGRKTVVASGLGAGEGPPCAAMFWHKTPKTELSKHEPGLPVLSRYEVRIYFL